MQISIINDCKDANAQGRQCTRAGSLLGGPVSFVGVSNDLEAAGNLIDVLDAQDNEAGVVLVNVAPRHGVAKKKWENGTPFGFFYYKNTLVLASIDGHTLSLVKKFALTDVVHVFDIPTVATALVAVGYLSKEVAQHITCTQFRSFDFLPRVAHALIQGIVLPSTPYPIHDVVDIPPAVWWVDNFGNCKTTITLQDGKYEEGKCIKTTYGDLRYYTQLKDVPDNTSALVCGSSGINSSRFLELVVQGGSASERFDILPGTSKIHYLYE